MRSWCHSVSCRGTKLFEFNAKRISIMKKWKETPVMFGYLLFILHIPVHLYIYINLKKRRGKGFPCASKGKLRALWVQSFTK